MANNGQGFKPAKMAQTTWDYLLKFTTFHEGVVNHMYHNFPLGSKYPDVSCGIGFLLQGTNAGASDTTVKGWLNFFIQADGTPVTEELFKTDWDNCYKIKRVSQPKGGLIAEFSTDCKLRIRGDLVRSKMAQILVGKLNTELNGSLSGVNFWALPAIAQVGIASLSYGYSLSKMPNFCKAIKTGNFEWAAAESKLSNMSDIKSYDHRLLFLDAEYLNKYYQEDQVAMAYLPLTISKWTTLQNQSGAIGIGGKSEQIMSE